MKRTTERKWHSWLNGVALTTCPSMWRRQRRLWWTSGETLLTTPHWPSTPRLWRESAALNSWGCTSQRTSPGLPTPSLSPRRHNSAYTFSAGWKEQASLHPSSPPSTGVPLRACWPAASLSGTETVVQQTARPSSGQWTPLQKSLVPLSPPSWIFSLHDAPAKQKVSWRTPPTPPTVSYSSYPQVDGTGVSEPAPPDCSTAFSPRLWEPWTHITQPLSETPNNRSTNQCFVLFAGSEQSMCNDADIIYSSQTELAGCDEWQIRIKMECECDVIKGRSTIFPFFLFCIMLILSF